MSEFLIDDLALREWCLDRWDEQKTSDKKLGPEQIEILDLSPDQAHWVDETLASLIDEEVITCTGPWAIVCYPLDLPGLPAVLLAVRPTEVDALDFFQISSFANAIQPNTSAIRLIREAVRTVNRLLAYAETLCEAVGIQNETKKETIDAEKELLDPSRDHYPSS